MQLVNPFTPSTIISDPDAFYGRDDEMQVLTRALQQGSIAIQGPVGIGKSSLLSRVLLHMDGFLSDVSSQIIIAVGHHDIKTVDDAARIILEELCHVDSTQRKLTIGIPKLATYESQDANSFFETGRYLSALIRILEDHPPPGTLDRVGYLVIAIDECDKCAKPIAQLMRQLLTRFQLGGKDNLRFVVSGVSPFFDQMVNVDQGISRFIYKTLVVGKIDEESSSSLLRDKLAIVRQRAVDDGIDMTIDPSTIHRVLCLADGHPHLLQLLGSHLIEQENENPDNRIDSRDLLSALRRICYESRASVYNNILHSLECEGLLNDFKILLQIAGRGFPTRIAKFKAQDLVSTECLEWLHQRNIIADKDTHHYQLVDEFLRIRIILDEEENITEAERRLIEDDYQYYSRIASLAGNDNDDDALDYEELMINRY